VESETLLLVGADPSAFGGLIERLCSAGHRVEHARGRAAAESVLRGGHIGLVLAELEVLGTEGVALAAGAPGEPAIVLLESFGSAEDALEALRRGASAVLSRPLPDGQVLLAVERALASRRLDGENRRLREDLGQRFELANLVSADPRMKRVFSLVEAVADTRANLLIEGESGTGKTRLARAVHQLSSRADGPFVEVNCGALPKDLLESELFGHVRGAFTGAVRDREGKFEAAHGGTLFLDEIATASLELQVKLLRVLESRRFERVGDEVTREVDVRIIAASNRDLALEVAAGRFREDLYFRIQVVAIELPPLRERPLDIPLLAERFLTRFTREHGREGLSLSPPALRSLMAHEWPGNVRELEHALERAVLLAAGTSIAVEDLPAALGRVRAAAVTDSLHGFATGAPLGPLRRMLEGPERAILQRALAACGGCRNETAQLLDINRTTLFNKMRKFGLLSFPTRAVPGGSAEAR